jgi:hypothetical protein
MPKTNGVNVLEQARSAKTATDLADAIERINAAADEERTTRADLSKQFQDALISGGATSKIEAAIADTERDIATLENAAIAFGRKRDEAEATEKADEIDALRRKAGQTAEALRLACQRAATTSADHRTAMCDVDILRQQLSRENDRLEASGISRRDLASPRTIAAKAIGDVPLPKGATVFGRRVDDILHDVMKDLTTGRDVSPRRPDALRYGREGETRAAQSQILSAAHQRASQ